MIAYIPSPPADGISVGPLQLHFYGLLIAIAVLVAAWLAQRRWAQLGGFPGTIVPLAFWGVVSGLIGARLYSVVTSWQQDTGGHPVQIFEIWNGGLGIWGGVAGGVLGGWLKARRMGLRLPPLLDVVAPALALAQAIGRWGNYFNQELFGLPSKLPWAVRITDRSELSSIPVKYQHLSATGALLPGTYQPTFLYESIWDLVTFGLLLLIERRVRLRRGYLFAAYASLYTFGRFFTEYLRIDPAHRYLGLRLNDWTAIGIFAVAASVLWLKGRPQPGDELVGDPLSARQVALERARARSSSGATPARGPRHAARRGPTVVAIDDRPEGTTDPERGAEAGATTALPPGPEEDMVGEPGTESETGSTGAPAPEVDAEVEQAEPKTAAGPAAEVAEPEAGVGPAAEIEVAEPEVAEVEQATGSGPEAVDQPEAERL
ncbi:MAG: prolipoprotein diacylglyceryl transferase [Acidimicrobiales bacterium]